MANLDNVKLVEILPPSIKNDAQFQAAVTVLDTQLAIVNSKIASVVLLPRIAELPEDVLDALAWQLHVDFYEPVGFSVEKKRALITQSIAWHRHKGTPWAVEQIVSAAFDESEVTEWFEYNGQPGHFKVRTSDINTSAEHLERVRRAVDSVKNTRSWMDAIEFILHLNTETDTDKDDIDLEELFYLAVSSRFVDQYPWPAPVHDGIALRKASAMHNAGFVHDGGIKRNGARAGDVSRDNVIDPMSILTVNLRGLEESPQINYTRNAINFRNGIIAHGATTAPIDDGGLLEICRTGRHSGIWLRDGGRAQKVFYNNKFARNSKLLRERRGNYHEVKRYSAAM